MSSAHAEQKVLAANKTGAAKSAEPKSAELGALQASPSTALAVSDLETVANSISRDQAIKLAEQHLTLRNNRWGHAVEVKDVDDEFVVVFETPMQESRLIGQRAVTVDKESGLAHVRDRR